MIWNRPLYLIALLAVPIIIIFYPRFVSQRYKKTAEIFSPTMLARLAVPRSRLQNIIRLVCFVVAFVALILCLADPRSTQIEEQTTSNLGRDVFVVLDVSESMNSEDVKPNRLSVAKLDVEDLLDVALGDRIGLIAFAGAAQVEIPLTNDYEFFRNVLRKVDTTAVQSSGTAVGDAVRLAIERFGNNSPNRQAIVLITDGEDHNSLPLEAARNAAEKNIPIFAIAIGSLSGAKIPTLDASGIKTYKMFDGEFVVSKPDTKTLKEMAEVTGGSYYYADANFNLADVYKTDFNSLERSELSDATSIQFKKLYQPFLIVSIIAFVLHYFLPSYVKRPMENKTILFKTLPIVLCATALFFTTYNDGNVFASSSRTIDSSEPTAASARQQKTKSEVESYNQAIYLYQEGNIEEAYEKLRTLSNARNQEVASRSCFNLGVEALTRAKGVARDLEEQFDSNSSDSSSPNTSDENSPNQNDTNILISNYNNDRKTREQQRSRLAEASRESIRYFHQSFSNDKLSESARRNLDTVAKWTTDTLEKEEDREFELRNHTLATPEMRIAWLENELNEKIEFLKTFDNDAPPVSAHKVMSRDSRTILQLEKDFREVVAGYKEKLQDKINEEYAAQFETTNKRFTQALKRAAEELSNCNAYKSRQFFREAFEQVEVLRNIVTPYSEHILQLEEQEKRELNDLAQNNVDNITSSDIESFYWNRKYLLNSVIEIEEKARAMVEENQNITDEKSTEVISNEHIPDSAGSRDVEALNQQDKVLESARIALDYQPELCDRIAKMKNLLGDDRVQKETLLQVTFDELLENQKEIARIIQEIAQPLHDNNPDNEKQSNNKNEEENEKNQEQNNDNSDRQNNPSQNNSQSGKDDDSEQKPPQDKKDNESNDADKDNPNREPKLKEDRSTDSKDKDAQKETKEKSKAEKEAELMIRQVERRQKDVEEQRRLLREASRRRETSGKDW